MGVEKKEDNSIAAFAIAIKTFREKIERAVAVEDYESAAEAKDDLKVAREAMGEAILRQAGIRKGI